MGYPEINNTNDQTDSNAETNSSPLDSTSMTDESFNEIYGRTQSNEQVSFLPSDDELLSQLTDTSSNQFSDTSYYQFSDTSSNQFSDSATKQTTDQAPKQSTPDVTQLSERPAQQFPRSEKNHMKSGPIEIGLDENGDAISVTGPRGEYFYKGSDGKWVEHMPPDKERTVEDLKFDKDGNMEFDVVGNGYKAHHKRNADGSHSIDSPEHGGKLVYDKDGNLTEAPAGEGHTRKFHYDKDGQLDKIDGRLGQWERKVEDGKVVWVNNKGVRWEGEMHVNPKTNDLEFRGRNGAAWNFTTRGKDVPVYSR